MRFGDSRLRFSHVPRRNSRTCDPMTLGRDLIASLPHRIVPSGTVMTMATGRVALANLACTASRCGRSYGRWSTTGAVDSVRDESNSRSFR